MEPYLNLVPIFTLNELIYCKNFRIQLRMILDIKYSLTCRQVRISNAQMETKIDWVARLINSLFMFT